jgi:dihydrofolate reductase
MTIQPFHMIVAAAANRGIGNAGKIPWRIPEDVRYFKNITCLFRDTHTINKFEDNLNRIKRQKIESNIEKDKSTNVTDNFPIKLNDNIPPNVVVMGRNTWESIPSKFRPMPNRINVVLSRNKEYSKNLPKEVQCYVSLKECLENLNKQEHGTIFLIGGGQIYNEGIKHPNCESLFITRVHGKYECDTFFPEIPEDVFKLSDDTTNDKMFINCMRNCEFVKGVQTNEKSGVKFEFQIYTRFQNNTNEDETLPKKLTIDTPSSPSTTIVNDEEIITESIESICSSPKSPVSTISSSSGIVSIPESMESLDSIETKSGSIESDIPGSPIQHH